MTPRPATAAGAGSPGNGAADYPSFTPPVTTLPRPSAPNRPPSGGGRPPTLLGDDDGSGGTSDLTRVLTALAAVAVIAAIVIVLLTATSGGGTPKSSPSTPSTPVSNAPSATAHHTRPRQPAVVDANVTVGVLNGTAQSGLASFVASELGADGFKSGQGQSTVANAANQTQTTTTVEYMPGDERDASAVAKALSLGAGAVQPITPDTQSLGCSSPSSCSVVVTVGQDLAGTQTLTTSTTPTTPGLTTATTP